MRFLMTYTGEDPSPNPTMGKLENGTFESTIAQRIVRVRPALIEDAVRLGRVLVGLVPDEPEVCGLCALMELHASRVGARTGPNGQTMTLLDQNRGRWDHVLIQRGLVARARCRARRVMRARRSLPHRLGADRAARPVVDRRAQSRHGDRDGRGSGGRTRDHRDARDRSGARALSMVAGCASGSAGQARAIRRGTRTIHARGGADKQQSRSRAPARARGVAPSTVDTLAESARRIRRRCRDRGSVRRRPRRSSHAPRRRGRGATRPGRSSCGTRSRPAPGR